MAVVNRMPADGVAGVPTDVVPELDFSDYPDPDTVEPNSLLLTTGVFRVPETYRVDLADKAVLLTPVAQLTPLLGYSVSLFADLRSLAGCAATADLASFRTGNGPTNSPPPPVPTFADVQPILDARCAGSCHADTGGGCLAAPAAGLSLCAADARGALVNVPSREVSALLLVAPGDSARSYLLRKILPATVGGGPIPTTLGEREPPGDPLTAAQIHTIAAWIDGDAPP
jgi:hypothetical protein